MEQGECYLLVPVGGRENELHSVRTIGGTASSVIAFILFPHTCYLSCSQGDAPLSMIPQTSLPSGHLREQPLSLTGKPHEALAT